jgi:hypothetical protein
MFTVVGAYPKLRREEIGEEHEENAGDEPEEEIPLRPAPPGLQLVAAHHDFFRHCASVCNRQLTFVSSPCFALFYIFCDRARRRSDQASPVASWGVIALARSVVAQSEDSVWL